MILKKLLPFLLWLFSVGYSNLCAQSGGSCLQEAVVTTRSGATSVDICQGDGLPDIFRFKTTPAAMPFAYLITNENNIILGVSASNIINLEGYPVGALRVWAFSYLGSITAQPGQSATAGPLASICSGLSGNFVTVNSINPNGGTVSTAEGANSAFACVDNTGSSSIAFVSSNPGPNYSFVVTTEANIIVGVATGGVFDFATVPSGSYRVWGVAHAGALNAPIGANITTTVLSSQCFGLSSNFVKVLRSNADGGTVRPISGAAEIKFCRPEDAVAVGLTSDMAAPASYAYVLTTTGNIIISILPGNTFNPSGLPLGNYRIWGLSFTGNVLAQPGQDAAATMLTDGCYDLSSNFIPVFLQDVKGGNIQLVSGPSALCVGDGHPDALDFSATGNGGGNYAYIVTDANAGQVLAFSTTNTIDFEDLGAGEVLVWGLSYTGTLNIQAGQTVASLLQSLECSDLSDNSVPFTLTRTNGGAVSLLDGGNSINVCTADGTPDELSFVTTSDANVNYTFVVTDAANNIIAFSASGLIDFEGAGAGVARVWGLSYSGNLTAQTGDNAGTDMLSDACFSLSDNFVTINLLRTTGGTVSIAGGGVFASLCVNDGEADLITFSNNSGYTPNYVYLITDESNIVLDISSTGMFNFEGTGSGLVRVWGLSYTGVLSVQPGDDAGAIALSSQCYSLSDNWVAIRKEEADGGAVQTLFGETNLAFCGGDGFADLAVYFSNTQSVGNYVFLVTDANNGVLVVNSSNTIDFESFGSGNFRIWGLSYTGNLTVQVGDIASSAVLSDRCYDLSDNFIAVQVTTIDGGVLSLLEGGAFYRACASDGNADIPQVMSTANDPNVEYTWLLTNAFNDILAISPNAAFDLDGFAPGNYRIWGLGYTGNLLAVPGQNAGAVALASNCFSLSLNFIEVAVDVAIGGTIGMVDGVDFISVCLGDDLISGPFAFTTTGNASGEYVFVLTDDNNVIVNIFNTDVFGFDESLPEGNYRIWGLAYSGTLTAQIGDNAAEVELSSGCYDLSQNFVPLVAGFTDAGVLVFSGGGTQRLICPNNGIADILDFNTSSTSILPYRFLITDADNVIVDIISDLFYDFDLAGYDELRVWGLSYSGDLLAEVGATVTGGPLSSECYALSALPLTVLLQTPDGGSVSLPDGSTFISACAGASSDVLNFLTNSSFQGNYTFAVTNTSNVILGFSTGNSYDFSTLSNDTMRVWGLAYTGNVLAGIGDNAATTVLADDCYDLSNNFITVYRANPVGGILTTPSGQTAFQQCAGDGTPDTIDFDVQGASNAPYVFLITDENNYLIGITNTSVFDFENAIQGVFRIYGLSYTGVFQLFPGDSIFGPIPASTGCFDFSDNFIEVNNIRVNGGTVSSQDQRTTFYTCPADGVPDVITFVNNSNAPGATYAYLFTNENNVILGLTFQNSFNFDIAGIGVTRVWGVSFTGNFIANFGDNAATTPLSDQCYDLSNNFLTVIRDVPSGGTVATSGGETDVVFCQGLGNPALQAVSTSASLAAYAFVLTDQFNDIIAFSANGLFNLSSLSAGSYRIWGVSYTGVLNPQVENLLDVELGSSCLEISANFITVTVTVPIVGGMLSANGGLTDIKFCPGNGISDLVEVSSTSPTPASNYRYVVTNQNGLVFIPDLMGNAIDFDGAGIGEYRIYAIAFSGNYLVSIGTNLNTATLASGCFDVSDNFIRVTNAVANGGTVSTDEGATTLNLDTQDGQPDEYTFIRTGAASLPYLYVLTDDANIVLEYLSGDTYDFEGRTEPGLRVWGLSYFGPAPTATGVPISSLTSSTSCSDLSDNFVAITTIAPTIGSGDRHADALLRVTAQPNPAIDRVLLNVWSKIETGSQATVRILDNAGKLRRELRIAQLDGFQQMELDISNLEDGIYTVHILSDHEATVVRVVKSRL